jgi:hypothetical protein
VEQERDYYYSRLHKLELLCNDLKPEETVTVGQILSILYQEVSDANCVFSEYRRSAYAPDDVGFFTFFSISG